MKYLSRKAEYDGIVFDSKKELLHYIYLKQLEKDGIIRNLELQKPIPFIYNKKPMFKYIADFVYDDEFGKHIIDVKSDYTAKLPVFRLKKKLIEAQYNIEIEVIN